MQTRAVECILGQLITLCPTVKRSIGGSLEELKSRRLLNGGNGAERNETDGPTESLTV